MSSNKTLITWIGGNDLNAPTNDNLGPILSTLNELKYDSVHLLYNYPKQKVDAYLVWLTSKINTKITLHKATLSSPTHFAGIYEITSKCLYELRIEGIRPDILLSPGTPAMQAIWLILGKTKYPSRFIQSSLERGVEYVEIPFEIAAEYTPTIQALSEHSLQKIQDLQVASGSAFDDITTQNLNILNLKKQAEILAGFDVPVLINGETGTGKELFARAIHFSSNRKEKPFIAVNCGALVNELIDSQLFGHKKGAFTGANQDHLGVFREANGGTVFLDEFGELPHSAQLRLLRVLQEGTVTPVGSSQEISLNVRVLAATHKNLMEMVSNGSFREDLFYRMAVGVINIPPIRERDGDLLLLSDSILKLIKSKEPSFNNKYFSVSAKNIILNHSWPGNVRELQSTIMRAALWSVKDEIIDNDISNAILKIPNKIVENNIIDMNQPVDINNEISILVSNYIKASLAKTGHNKTKAAELLGLKNYQTLNNWMEKYGIH